MDGPASQVRYRASARLPMPSFQHRQPAQGQQRQRGGLGYNNQACVVYEVRSAQSAIGNHHLKVHAPELVERLASRSAETDVVNKAFQRPGAYIKHESDILPLLSGQGGRREKVGADGIDRPVPFLRLPPGQVGMLYDPQNVAETGPPLIP